LIRAREYSIVVETLTGSGGTVNLGGSALIRGLVAEAGDVGGSTFSMIKAKFGGRIRSKGEVGQVNEALLKVLCHNIVVVGQSMHEQGVEPTFWTESAVVQKVPV
jgi:hypothetical protein